MVAMLLLLVMQACMTVEEPGGGDAPGGGEAPTLRSYADGDNTAPAVVRFEADADGSPVAYEWSIDGEPIDEIDAVLDRYFAQAGEYRVSVTVVDAGGGEATATTTVEIEPAESPFTIDVRFFDDEGMTLEQRRAFSAAARRWAEVIQADFTPYPLSKSANECRAGEPGFDGVVDDILIYASITDIDGRDGILAQAGPCAVTEGDLLPIYGVMQFDVTDLPQLSDQADLEGVILHEMGHVLGIGTIWSEETNELLDPPICYGAIDPRYVGANAVDEWQGYGGSGYVPVEAGATNDGTACGHWRERTASVDLFNELMTGYLDVTMDLSRITIGALDDLGYAVDYSAADPFDLFPALRSADEERDRLTDRLLTPTEVLPGRR